ncbi:HEAT repeat domain-containing protein [Streptomyces sp. NPDC051018]|uniref:HEAT repeat domain-containing protein n=1 Tax=Streptomyces sp. NPDC051018 TaxID=3365639 RepID=UPI0037A38248
MWQYAVWRWWRGSLTCPDRPRRHPNFPRAGLRRFADAPDPKMRRLALDDPESTPALVERLSRDPDGTVRHEAAADLRLSAGSALRLLDDPEHRVRQAAAHPGHPADVVALLLLDHHVAATAARSHPLPAEVVRRMIDRVTGRPSAPGPHTARESRAP